MNASASDGSLASHFSQLSFISNDMGIGFCEISSKLRSNFSNRDAQSEFNHHAGADRRHFRGSGKPGIVAQDSAPLPLHSLSGAQPESKPGGDGGATCGDTDLVDLRTGHRSRQNGDSFPSF